MSGISKFREYIVKIGNGSGCLFQPKGEDFTYVLTAHHVIKGKKKEEISIVRKWLNEKEELETEELTIIEGPYHHTNKYKDAAIICVKRVENLDSLNTISDIFGEIHNYYLCGYPNIRKNEENTYRHNELTLSDKIDHGYIEAEINKSTEHKEIVGASGGGILKFAKEKYFIAGIQKRMAMDDEKELLSRIWFMPLTFFDEIIEEENSKLTGKELPLILQKKSKKQQLDPDEQNIHFYINCDRNPQTTIFKRTNSDIFKNLNKTHNLKFYFVAGHYDDLPGIMTERLIEELKAENLIIHRYEVENFFGDSSPSDTNLINEVHRLTYEACKIKVPEPKWENDKPVINVKPIIDKKIKEGVKNFFFETEIDLNDFSLNQESKDFLIGFIFDKYIDEYWSRAFKKAGKNLRAYIFIKLVKKKYPKTEKTLTDKFFNLIKFNKKTNYNEEFISQLEAKTNQIKNKPHYSVVWLPNLDCIKRDTLFKFFHDYEKVKVYADDKPIKKHFKDSEDAYSFNSIALGIFRWLCFKGLISEDKKKLHKGKIIDIDDT